MLFERKLAVEIAIAGRMCRACSVLSQVFVMSERNRFLQPMGWASGIFEKLVTLDCNHHTRYAVHGKRARPIALAHTQQPPPPGPLKAPKIHALKTNRWFKTAGDCIWLETKQLADQTDRGSHPRTCACALHAIRIFAFKSKWVIVARPYDANPMAWTPARDAH
jgi:hypothetical protein